MDATTDFKTHQERIASSLVNVVRTASQISSQDLSFHRAANEDFSQLLDTQNSHLLKLTNKILKASVKDTTKKAPALQDLDGVDENWAKVTEVIDDLLEKADTSLDEFTGVLKRINPNDSDATQPPTKKIRQGTGIDQWARASMQKPQLNFERKVNNYDTSTWKPLLKTKPHALVSLENSIGNGDGGQVDGTQKPDISLTLLVTTTHTHTKSNLPVILHLSTILRHLLDSLHQIRLRPYSLTLRKQFKRCCKSLNKQKKSLSI